MPGYISIKRSLQVNMVASALFTLPFFALGPFEFASLLVDGSVSAAQMGSGPAAPFLKHLLWVDAIKNCLITYWCHIAQGWTAKAQKQVIVGFVAMWASAAAAVQIRQSRRRVQRAPPARHRLLRRDLDRLRARARREAQEEARRGQEEVSPKSFESRRFERHGRELN
jgi:hypothetical protein